MTIRNKFILLVAIACLLLLLKNIFFSLSFNAYRESFHIISFGIDDEKDDVNDLINLGFSAFEYQQAKRQEANVCNEYDLTATLLHWKRLEGLQKTLHHLLQTNFFKEIIVWNNNPQINLTHKKLTQHSQFYKFIRIINAKENLKDEAKYRACTQAKTRACFYVDDDYNAAYYLKSLIASFRSDPYALHSVTDAYTFYTNLIWSYFDPKINLHSGFSWIGCGSIFLRQHAQQHLQLMSKYLQNHTGLSQFGDVFFSIWLNDIPVQMNTILHHQPSRSVRSSVSFSSTQHFSHLQYTSSVLAIRILEHSLRFDRSKENNITFSHQQNRRFPSYIKSPSLKDDFIFYTNILPIEFVNISFNITRDFERGTRKNLPRNANVKFFQYHGTLNAADGDLSTCWQTHREIRFDDFYAIDFLSIQSTIIFTIAVAHSARIQADLDVQISFDGLYWMPYQSINGIYKKINRTLEEHLYTYLFDSNEFNLGFRSFRYISFIAKTNRDDRFQVCEIQILPNEKITHIKLDFYK